MARYPHSGNYTSQVGYPMPAIVSQITTFSNRVNREHMLHEIHAKLPGLSSWVECCYSTELHLFGDYSLLSYCGDLEDSQVQTTLLRSCLSSLQTCPSSVIQKAISFFDDTVRRALEDISGGLLPDWAWLKANLPCSLGGLSLRSAVLHAPAAYIRSITESIDLVSKILGCKTYQYLQ